MVKDQAEWQAFAQQPKTTMTNAVDGILSTFNSTPLVPFSPYNATQVIEIDTRRHYDTL